MTEPKSYPCGNLLDMAAIPADVRPRFLAELPDILDRIAEMDEAMPSVAEQTRANMPAWLRWLFPQEAVVRSFRRQIGTKSKFVDDDKSTANISVRMAHGHPMIFTKTVPLKGDAQ